jgi:type 1 fimbriae regulatory protein FimB/type 1 fimbriae regulatory protein FimE
MKSHLRVVAPATEKQTVGRKPNSEYRTREYLIVAEVTALIETAKGNRWGHRDATMILVAFRQASHVAWQRLTAEVLGDGLAGGSLNTAMRGR